MEISFSLPEDFLFWLAIVGGVVGYLVVGSVASAIFGKWIGRDSDPDVIGLVTVLLILSWPVYTAVAIVIWVSIGIFYLPVSLSHRLHDPVKKKEKIILPMVQPQEKLED